MNAAPVSVLGTGLVTSVGLSSPATCAAIRAKISNPSETAFLDAAGEWLMAHQVQLERPWRGVAKLVRMAALAIEEALADLPRKQWSQVPMLLCVADRERPGRPQRLDEDLFFGIQQQLGAEFSSRSAIVAEGAVSVARALAHARELLVRNRPPCVLIAAADSLVSRSALSHYESEARLLTSTNSNGFIAGEAAGALLVGAGQGGPALTCTGLGFGVEHAHVVSNEPLRADGLTQAIKTALGEAGCELHDLDFQITGLSGEQYFFKEASLAISRILRRRTEEFEMWHPAESIGEVGAAIGAVCLAMGHSAAVKGFSPGKRVILHFAGDGPSRGGIVASLS